jgi:hypothetical protein
MSPRDSQYACAWNGLGQPTGPVASWAAAIRYRKGAHASDIANPIVCEYVSHKSYAGRVQALQADSMDHPGRFGQIQ